MKMESKKKKDVKTGVVKTSIYMTAAIWYTFQAVNFGKMQGLLVPTDWDKASAGPSHS